MDAQGLLSLYTYNAYANGLVLDTVAQLAGDEFTRQSSPSHGSVRTLLHRMLAVEAYFLAFAQQHPFERDREALSSLEAIRRRWMQPSILSNRAANAGRGSKGGVE